MEPHLYLYIDISMAHRRVDSHISLKAPTEDQLKNGDIFIYRIGSKGIGVVEVYVGESAEGGWKVVPGR